MLMEEESGHVDHGSGGFRSTSVGPSKDRRYRSCQAVVLVQTRNTVKPNNNFIKFTKLGTLARIYI
jgi:hypothetical protein